VLEVTARSAADVLGIQHNTAALFYKKVLQVITHHLQQKSSEMFEGDIELDERYFAGKRKGKRGRGAAGKVAILAFSSATERSTQRWSTTQNQDTDAHYFLQNQA